MAERMLDGDGQLEVQRVAGVAGDDVTEQRPAQQRQVTDLVEHLVLALPPKERACVLLKDVFDYSLEEIAALVDSTVGGVKAYLSLRGVPVRTRSDE